MTIGAAPSSESLLVRELQLVKVGVLYADEVSLYSPTSVVAQLLRMTRGLKQTISIDKMDTATLLGIILIVLIYFTTAKNDERKKAKARLRELWAASLDATAGATLDHVSTEFARLLDRVDTWMDDPEFQAAADDLDKAVAANLLRIHELPIGNPDEMLSDFIRMITDEIKSGNTFPLLDVATSILIKGNLNDDTGNTTQRIGDAKHTRLAVKLFERLPAFETASMDEILDIRRDLAPYLASFRSGLIEVSKAISRQQWEEGFEYEAEALLLQKVAPAVNEIEEAVRSQSFLRTFISKVVDKPLLVAPGALGLMLAHQLPAVSSVLASLVSLGVPAAFIATKTQIERADQLRQIEQHQMYFYYKAAQRLRI